MDVRRWLPLSGVVFVVLALVAVVALGGDTPESSASGSEVASFYDGEAWPQGIAAFVFAASIPFLVFFAVSLAAAVPSAPHERRVWEHVLIGGAVLTGATLALGALFHFGLVDGADNGASPEALQAINILDANSWVAFNSGLGVMMLGAAGCVMSRIGSWRWLGWVALVLGILLFVPFADFFALLLALLWIIVTSIMLFRAAPANGSVISATGAG
jgi:hypothetical protein